MTSGEELRWLVVITPRTLISHVDTTVSEVGFGQTTQSIIKSSDAQGRAKDWFNRKSYLFHNPRHERTFIRGHATIQLQRYRSRKLGLSGDGFLDSIVDTIIWEWGMSRLNLKWGRVMGMRLYGSRPLPPTAMISTHAGLVGGVMSGIGGRVSSF